MSYMRLRILDSGKCRSRFFMVSYRLHSMYSKTKNSSSFSRITSLSLMMFGWFSFLSDWLVSQRLAHASGSAGPTFSATHVDLAQLHALLPRVELLLHALDRDLPPSTRQPAV